MTDGTLVIAGFSKLTLLDFPGRVAAEVFLQGCGMRCPFCHNAALCPGTCPDPVPWTEVLAYLEARRSMLDGVVFTGGEPLMQEVMPAMEDCRRLGLEVKLDTNGTCPAALDLCVHEKLVDYIAMDVKANAAGYPAACGLPAPGMHAIRESIRIVAGSGLAHEFRTTVTPSLHSPESIGRLCREFVPEGSAYFIQPFVPRDTVPDKTLEAPDEAFLAACLREARRWVPKAEIRGG